MDPAANPYRPGPAQRHLRYSVETISSTASESPSSAPWTADQGRASCLSDYGGYHVWNHAVTSPITPKDVNSVRPVVIDQLDRNFFLVRFDRLTPKEREYLRAMADLGPGPHRSGDIAGCLGIRVESVAPRRSELISKGMIYSPAHGDTAFTVPLFDEYLRRAMPDWQRPPKRRPSRKPAGR